MNKETFDSLTPEMQDTYIQFCLPDDLSKLTIDSVILSPVNKKLVDDFLEETMFKEKYVKYGLKPCNRILNSGASGTGKTFLTKCLAAHLGYELLAIDINNALDSGNAAQAIERVFELGNHLGKCIIFLDECDVIATNREDKSRPLKPGTREAINGIFQLLDRMNPECIFVACTNLLTDLDVAFVRRFADGIKLQFERPKLDNLEEAIEKFMHPAFTMEHDMDAEIKAIVLDYARNYTGLSYDEIQTWVERAEKIAIRRDSEEIRESEIYSFFMNSLRIKVCTNEKDGTLYLHQIG